MLRGLAARREILFAHSLEAVQERSRSIERFGFADRCPSCL